jgi:hypothetical protein
MPHLILERAPMGWNQEHYDVLEDGVVVGHIFLMPIGYGVEHGCGASGHMRRAAHGYEQTREAAMASFAKSWRRE